MKETKPSSYKILQSKFKEVERNFLEVQNKLLTAADSKKPKRASISGTIPMILPLYRVREDITTWRNALIYAESIIAPIRTELLRLYKDLLLDNHLSSLIDNRKDPILGADFIVMKDGKEIDEFKDMFRTKWFTDFVNLALDSIYFGFSVIEFGNLVNGEFSEINLTPREYCKP
jgi:hypothetical protein